MGTRSGGGPRRITRALIAIAVVLGGGWAAATQVSGAEDERAEVGRAFESKAFEDARRKDEEAAERRRSAQAREERDRSRTAHRGMGQDAARELLWRTFPGVVGEPVYEASGKALGGKVVRRPDRHHAIVEREGGRRLLVQSTRPLTTGGEPVDLSLRPDGGDIAPAQPLVATRLGARGQDGVSFPGKGFGVRLRGASGAAQVVDDRAFYPTTETDTDYLVMPQPDGVETFTQLRSAASPEQLEFELDLPEGSQVRRMRSADEIPNDPPEALEIVKDGERLGILYPPSAFDADGEAVPVAGEMDGRTFRVRVDHRDGDFRYPVLVDPYIAANSGYLQNDPKPWTDLGWHFRTGIAAPTASHQIGIMINNPAYFPGLYLSLPTNNTYTQGASVEWGELHIQAPSGAYIAEAQFGNISHSPNGSGAYHGLLDANNQWQPNVTYTWTGAAGSGTGGNPSYSTGGYAGTTDSFCFVAGTVRCNVASPTDHNRAVFGINVPNPYSTGSVKATKTMGWATLSLGDRYAPTFVNPPADGAWFNDGNATQSLSVAVNDYGLGTEQVFLGTQGKPAACDHGTPAKPWCVNRDTTTGPFTYQLDEGSTTLNLLALDLVGNAASHSFVRRVDRTPPTFTLPGPVKPDATLKSGSHNLVVDARDVGAGGAENSGVKTFRMWVDGVLQTQTATCASGACSKTFTLNAASGGLAEGPHTVEVEVEDGVGLKSAKQTFSIIVDRTGPEFLETSGFLKHHVVSSGRQDLRAVVKDFAGSATGVNLLKGGSFEGDVPEGSTYSSAAGSVSSEVPAFHGTRELKLVADGSTDYAEIRNDSARIPVTPGERVTLSAYARSPQTGRTAQVTARFAQTLSDTPGSAVTPPPVAITNTGWTRVSGTVAAPNWANYVTWSVRVVGVAAGEAAYVDAVELENFPSLTAYASHADETPNTNSAGTNTIRNSSFETGVSGFFGYLGTLTSEAQAGAPHGGTVAKLVASSTYTEVGSNSGVSINPGEKVSVSGYARASVAGRIFRISARFFDASGALVKSSAAWAAASTTAWRRSTLTAVAPANAKTVAWDLAFMNVAVGETAWADAIQLERGDAVTPFGLHRDELPASQRSGVDTVQLLIDGLPRGTDGGACSDSTCSLRSAALSYDDATLPEGLHTVQVRATDKAGNVTLGRPWEIVVDRSNPQVVSTSGELKQGLSFGPGKHKAQVEATDFGATLVSRNLVPGSSFERGTPHGFWTYQNVGSVQNGPLTAAHGSRYFQGTQTGQYPLVHVDWNKLRVEPGDSFALSAYVRTAVASGRTASIRARYFSSTGVLSWSPTTSTPISNTGWTRVQNLATVPAGVVEMSWEVGFNGGTPGEVFMVDAIQVERGSTVGAFEASPSEAAAGLQRAGLYRLKLEQQPKGSTSSKVVDSLDRSCYDDSCSRLDWLSFDAADVPEGRQELRAKAEDMSGAAGTSPWWDVIIDRSAPSVSTTATTVKDATGGTQTYTLDITSRDGSTASYAEERSGAKSIEVQLRDEANRAAGFVAQPGTLTQTCAAGSCSQTRRFTLTRRGGRYTVRAIATDQVGNQRIRDRVATFDDVKPEIELGGTLAEAENQTISGGDYGLHVTATDLDMRSALREDFSAAAIDPSRWWAGIGYVTVVDGRAIVPCPSTYGSLYSAERFNFDETALTAEVPVKGATGNGTVQTYISVIAPATGDKLEIWRAGSNIGMYVKTGGVVVSNTYVPYNEEAMRWWRIRDDGGDVVFETSPDGVTWSEIGRKQIPFERNGVAVQLGCGYWGTENNPAPAQFDNVSVGEPVPGSGVRSIEVLTRPDITGSTFVRESFEEVPCLTGGCRLDSDWTFKPSQYAPGGRIIRVVATDELGNVATRDIRVVVAASTGGPAVSLGGGLDSAAAVPGANLEPGDYDLGVAVSGSTPLKSIEVQVDGVRQDYVEPTCPATGTCSANHTYTYTGDAFTPQVHEVAVLATTTAGATTAKRVVVNGNKKNSPIAVASGMEDWFETRSIETGAGSMAAVNLASGNLLWHHRVIANAGRGLSTNVDVTYNSLSSDLDQGAGYEEIGEGFSLGVSSLTRVNEAMDVRAAAGAGGVITLTDADGTMHRFTASPTVSGLYDPPAGVNLWLRRYYVTPSTDEQKKRAWAATRPDGTTYFFDYCGYQRYAADRNGNELVYTYDTSPAKTEADCHRQTHSAARPKLLKVTDAGGRSIEFTYEPSKAVGHSKRIIRIVDHAKRVTEFAYYNAQKKLKSIKQAAGTAQERTFTFDYETTGGDRDLTLVKDPRGNSTTFEHLADNAKGGAPNYGLGEAVTKVTDRDGKPTSYEYLAGSPYPETKVTDRRGKVWRSFTDSASRLRVAIDPLGRRTEQDWDPDNNPSVLRRAVGTTDAATTTAAYNSHGQPTSIIDAENRKTEFFYRLSNGVHELAPVDGSALFVSDLRQIKRPRNVTIDYTYPDDKGNPSQRSDEAGFLTQWDYGSGGVVVTERREIGLHQVPPKFAVTTFADHDANGLPRLVTDPKGNETLTPVTDGQWRMRYDDVGNVLDVRDPRSTAIPSAAIREAFTTEYEYDKLDRRTLERTPKLSVDGLFIERKWEYDANDNVRAFTDGVGSRFETEYTVRDDVSIERTPKLTHEGEGPLETAEETRYTYDPEQNLETRTDPLGSASGQLDDYSTLWTYDAAGQKLVERRRERTASTSKDLITSWAYDNRGNVRAMADPIRNTTAPLTPELNASDDLGGKQRVRMTYDKVDNVTVTAEDPAGKNLRTYRCYDAHDNVRSITDARGTAPTCLELTPPPFTTRMEYDGRDALVDHYDAANNRTHYDVRGDGQIERITTPRGMATPLPQDDYTTTLTYDSAGDLIRRSLPWAQKTRPEDAYLESTRGLGVDYTRNAVGDAVTIRDARNKPITNEFFDTGDIKSTTRPGFWIATADGVRERGPGDPPVEQGLKAAASNDAKGDFGSVEPEQLPSMLPKSGLVEFDYDNEMRLRTVTEMNPVIVPTTPIERRRHVLDRDVLGRVKTYTMPFGNGPNDAAGSAPRTIVNQYFYDRQDLRRVRDGDNFDTTFTYDQFGRRLTVTTPGSATSTETTTTQYDENGNTRFVITPRQTKWEYAYDSVDRVIKRIAPDTGVRTFDYDAVGNRTYMLPERGQNAPDTEKPKYAEYRTFNALNQLETLERGKFPSPNTRLTSYVYDADGNQVQVTAPGAAPSGTTPQPRITKRKFDARGLLWTETKGSDIYERTRATEYDGNGNLRRVVNPAGVTRGANPLPRAVDPGTLPVAKSPWTEHATVFTYDDDNLLASTYLPWGKKDAADEEAWRQHVERDNRGRIRVIQAPHILGNGAKKLTTYRYYDSGWIKSSVDALTYRPEDDDAPAPPRKGEHILRYDYDKRGNQTLWKSEALDPSPNATQVDRYVTRKFFGNGRLEKRTADKPGEPVRGYTYEYNPNGSMTKMVDDRSTPGTTDAAKADDRVTNFTYDPNDRPQLTNEVRPPTADGEAEPRDTLIAYDIGGNVTSRATDGTWNASTGTYSGGKATTFIYDQQDRETTMTVIQNGTRSRTTTWWPSDQVATHERKRPNNTTTTERRYFADDGRIVSRVRGSDPQVDYEYDDRMNGSTLPADWGNGLRSKDERGTYKFNARGQIWKFFQIVKSATTTTTVENTYDVDGSGAITKISNPAITRRYVYEGDRLKCEHTGAGGTEDDPCAGAETTYTYNAFDNVTRMTTTVPDRSSKRFSYDGFERMTGTGPLSGADTTTYDYDALDRRDAKYDVSQNNRRYDYSYVGASEALSREDAPGSETRFYDYDASLQRVGQNRRMSDGTTKYRGYALDANGNVLGLEGDTGAVAEADSYAYGAFGQAQLTATGDAAANPFRFQGHYYDESLEAYDMQARMYSPEIGRFLSPDRYESSTADLGLQLDPRTNNRFAFLAGNPVDQMELDGHKQYDCMTCGIGTKQTPEQEDKEKDYVDAHFDPKRSENTWNAYYGSQEYWAATTTQGKSAMAQQQQYVTNTMRPAFNQLGCHHRPGVICNEAPAKPGSWADLAGGAACEFSIGIVCFGDSESSAYKAGGIIVMLNPKGLVQAGGKKLIKEGAEEVAESKFGRETLGLMPDKRPTNPGFGTHNTPSRMSGPWTRDDLKQGAYGRSPRSMGEIDLHHGDQMPGSGVHEIPRDVHRRDSGTLHRGPNQGVTKEIRDEDRELHWWYRAQEMGGRDELGEEYFYDNWPG